MKLIKIFLIRLIFLLGDSLGSIGFLVLFIILSLIYAFDEAQRIHYLFIVVSYAVLMASKMTS